MKSIWKRTTKMFGYAMLIVAWIGITIPTFVYGFGYGIAILWRENVIENGANVAMAIAITPAIGILTGFAGIQELWFGALPIMMKADDSI